MEIFIFFLIVAILVLSINKEKKKQEYKPYSEKYKTYEKYEVKKEDNSKKNNKKEVKENTNIEEVNLSPTNIGKEFNKTAIEINKILLNLNWIEKKGKWTIATKEGLKNGAIENYNPKNKQKFVLWKNHILKNQKLIEEIEKTKINKRKLSQKEKKEKGDKYEKYVANKYRLRGYDVVENGLINGLKDGGIDLIATKGRECILIQCKNWSLESGYKIKHTHIKTLRTEARDFVLKNKELIKLDLRLRYVISENFIHQSAIKYIEESKKSIDYEIIKIEESLAN